MYVDIAHIKQNGKVYQRALLRESYRQDGKVKHRTIANLSKCSETDIQAIKFALKYKQDLTTVDALKDIAQTQQGLSVGAIILLKAMADRLHITQALGQDREGKLTLWQIMARVINQGSRLSAVRLAGQHAICDLLELSSFNEEDLYANLDWVCTQQEQIEKQLFERRYSRTEVPRLFLYDVTSSYLEGQYNELGDWGYNRDGKKGKQQIVIGLLTDHQGIPVSVEVFQGNTNDTKTVLPQIKKMAQRFGIQEVTLVGDRGMIKTAQIADLKAAHFHYITAITKAQIGTLLKKEVFQIDHFSEHLCEIESDGVRYILRRNPVRAVEIEQSRQDKIDKLQRLVAEKNTYLSEHPRAKPSVASEYLTQWLDKLKLSEFCHIEAKERVLSFKVDRDKKDKASLLDGCYVIKTELDKESVSADIIHQRYKDLALVEQGFRTIKTGLLETRPVFVRKAKRTRGHVLIVMLAYLMIQELQTLWAEADLTVEEGILELSALTTIEIQLGQTCYQQIPTPRELGRKLLHLAKVRVPHALPSKNIKVATRKKLTRK
jgi:Transposase DDE domain